MKRLCLFLLIPCILLTVDRGLVAQTLNVRFAISPDRDTFSISRYLYGSNGQDDDSSANITARRLGGNRLTGYNWENNASNAGMDYLNESDDYLTYQLPPDVRLSPAIVPIIFHQKSKSLGAYSLVTLPAAGFVAADESGIVDSTQTAPSSRWRKVEFAKGAAFNNSPDISDGFVYVDEEVHFLTQAFRISVGNGIRGYDCDNEPALWPSTHPRIHPEQTTCAEVITKDSALALAVKSVDSNAEIFGPVAYGFAEYLNNQTAPDWSNYSSYGRWIDAYLAKMHDASTARGKRLLDVLDLHWYPEALGLSASGTTVRITDNDDSDAGTARARMDAPRTLWDSTYTENSWIGEYFSPVALLPWLNASIATNYPGTKLSFSEFDYGGTHQISGAIATADVLGIFGKYHVYMANHWGTVTSFLASAYKIYRNYDGKNSEFGDIGVPAVTDNNDSTSVYAARSSIDSSSLDIIAINKSQVTAAIATIAITSSDTYTNGRVFMLQKDTTAIVDRGTVPNITGNSFTYQLPPESITHFVLRETITKDAVASTQPDGWQILSSARVPGGIQIRFEGMLENIEGIELLDVLGRVRSEAALPSGYQVRSGVIGLPVANISEGTYFVRVRSADRTEICKLVIPSAP